MPDEELQTNDTPHQERYYFIRNVYTMLTKQLAISVLIVYLIVQDEETRLLVKINLTYAITVAALSIFLWLLLYFVPYLSRSVPWNHILLVAITVSTSCLAAIPISYFELKEVFTSLAISLILVLALSIYATYSEFDFTGWKTAILLSIISPFLTVGAIFLPTDVGYIALILAAIIFLGVYMVIHTQKIMGKKSRRYDMDDRVIAAANLYFNIIYMLLKVYAIFTLQILSTIGFIAAFMFDENLQEFARGNVTLAIIATVCLVVIQVILVCFPISGRSKVFHFILLLLFTVCLDYFCALMVSYYPTHEILLAGGLCAIATILLTIFASQTTIDFTIFRALLFTLIPLLLIIIFVGIMFESKILYLIYVYLYIFFVCISMIMKIQAIVSGKSFTYNEDDYVLAALTLYMDVMYLFIYILAALGGTGYKILQRWSRFVSSSSSE